MKSLLGFILILGVVVASCKKTPVFPDPGFDATSDVVDTVRRDTINVYNILMNVNVPNGVKTIQVLDGLNYQELKQLNDYTNQTKFQLKYSIDLSSVTDRDSTFNYIIKVIDNDNRTYNKAFSITVKAFSKPTIHISGAEDVLGLVSPLVDLKMLFETGLNTIRSYKVLFDGAVMDQASLGDSLHAYNYSHVFNFSMVKGQNYTLRVELVDNKGTVGVKEITLKLIDLQRPVKVFVNSYSGGVPKLLYEIELFYNWSDHNKLDSMSRIIYNTLLINGVSTDTKSYYSYHFGYNNQGKVSRVSELNLSDGTWDTLKNCLYIYDANGLLTEARGADGSAYSMKMGAWYPDGRVKSYAYTPDWPITVDVPWHTNSSGESVMGETWVVSSRRNIATKVTPVLIPSYVSELPPFFPYNTGLLEEFQIMFMWKYGYEWIHDYNAAKKDDFQAYYSTNPRLEFAYVTNTNGRLEKIIKKTVSTSGVRTLSREYLFVY